MGGDLGGTGRRSLKNLRWWDGPCIRPPIFRAIVLSDALQSTNALKRGVKKECFVLKQRYFGKKMVIYVIYTRPGFSKLRPAGRIRPAKVSNPARGALPENINMGRKAVNDSGNYPF